MSPKEEVLPPFTISVCQIEDGIEATLCIEGRTFSGRKEFNTSDERPAENATVGAITNVLGNWLGFRWTNRAKEEALVEDIQRVWREGDQEGVKIGAQLLTDLHSPGTKP